MIKRTRKVDKSKLIELLSSGSIRAAARYFGVNHNAIRQWIGRHGIKVGKPFKRMSKTQLNQMLKMAANGVPYREIARQLNKSKNAIASRIGWHKSKGKLSPYKKKGERKTYAAPVEDTLLVEYSQKLMVRLKIKKRGASAEQINDAVNLALVEMRSRPAIVNWKPLFCAIADRRLVDIIREVLGRRGERMEFATAKKVTADDLADRTNISDLTDDVAALREAIGRLPPAQRKVITLWLELQNWDVVAEKLGQSISKVFVIRRLAIQTLQERLSDKD